MWPINLEDDFLWENSERSEEHFECSDSHLLTCRAPTFATRAAENEGEKNLELKPLTKLEQYAF